VAPVRQLRYFVMVGWWRIAAYDPEKLVFDLTGDGHRFSEKIMRKC
jgi:hypothetical protein